MAADAAQAKLDKAAKGEDEPKRAPKVGKNAVNGFNQKLEAMKRAKSAEEEEREKQKKQFEKKLKVKARYSKQLTRKNKNGQMVMSGMISHLLNKITRD